MVTAQTMYDLREEFEFCSGSKLQDWFAANLGDPSPSGRESVPLLKAWRFIKQCCDTMGWNSPSLMDQCARTKGAAKRALTSHLIARSAERRAR